MVVYTRVIIGNKKSLSDALLSVVFWCVLVRSLCSLWDLHSPWFICDVAVRHSHILIVARGVETWASAPRVLYTVLLHAHNALVTFPCL